MNRNIKNGFTLIELLVVVSILSILTLFAISRFTDSTQSSKIKIFESNFKLLIVYSEESYINNNNNYDKVYEEVNPKAINLYDKPKSAKYEVDDTNKIIKATLKKEEFNGTEDYIIIYDLKTSAITQSPNPIPKGATPLSTKNN